MTKHFGLSIPRIHLNGTSAESLCDEIRNAHSALNEARAALALMTVHGRDHYVKDDPESFDKARREHERRFVALDHIILELEEIYLGIRDQV